MRNAPIQNSEEPAKSCLAGVWIPKKNTSAAGAVGEAVVGTGDYIFIVWCRDYSTTPEFWRYDPSTDNWNESMNVSGLPIGAFRNGAALAWDLGVISMLCLVRAIQWKMTSVASFIDTE
jgi:hypothetical protein